MSLLYTSLTILTRMISQISIKNFGLIDELSIDFCNSLNIFTGETGAGKSILIDALRFSLGERLNSSFIRDKDKPCSVEVIFELTNKNLKEHPILKEYLTDDDPAIIISRIQHRDGRRKNKINGFSVTQSQLKKLGDHLIDFHGTHDHQMLFSEDSHIVLLDRLCDTSSLFSEYKTQYSIYLSLNKEYNSLKELSKTRERELDMLKHQIKELEQVPLSSEKYAELESEISKINNYEKLYEKISFLDQLLENESNSIGKTIEKAFAPMKDINELDQNTSDMYELLERLQVTCSDLSSSISDYISVLSFDQEKANEANRTYDIYYELIRKYGPSIEDVQDYYSRAQEKYALLIDLEHNDAELTARIKQSHTKLNKIASKITSERKKSAKMLVETIEKELKELGIKNVLFDCRITASQLNSKGQDKVVFYISPNLGEELKPLADIVSSGEAARVMLALKKALTKVDPIPVLIFDEIDAQIGGRLGSVTGKKLKELAQDRQVLLITHLPQIASFGDCHFKVLKQVKNKRTFTEINFLDNEKRIQELANMMGEDTINNIAIEHAKEMLQNAT